MDAPTRTGHFTTGCHLRLIRAVSSTGQNASLNSTPRFFGAGFLLRLPACLAADRFRAAGLRAGARFFGTFFEVDFELDFRAAIVAV